MPIWQEGAHEVAFLGSARPDAVRWLSAKGLSLAQDATKTDTTKPEAAKTCDVPAYLLNSESALPKVAAAVKNGQPLTILVVGSRSSTITSSEASAYPARLQAALKEKLPQVPVNLSVELQTSKTAEEVDSTLVKLVEAKKPTLVIWQTGTVDAMRSIDPDVFSALSTRELLCCKRREPTWF